MVGIAFRIATVAKLGEGDDDKKSRDREEEKGRKRSWQEGYSPIRDFPSQPLLPGQIEDTHIR